MDIDPSGSLGRPRPRRARGRSRQDGSRSLAGRGERRVERERHDRRRDRTQRIILIAFTWRESPAPHAAILDSMSWRRISIMAQFALCALICSCTTPPPPAKSATPAPTPPTIEASIVASSSTVHASPPLSDKNIQLLASGSGWWCMTEPPNLDPTCWRAVSVCEAYRVKREASGTWMPPCHSVLTAWCFGRGHDGNVYYELRCRGAPEGCEAERVVAKALEPKHVRLSQCRQVE